MYLSSVSPLEVYRWAYLDSVIDIDDVAAVKSWGRQRRNVDDIVIEGIVTGPHFAARYTEYVALAAVLQRLRPHVNYLTQTVTISYNKLSYRRETARQLHASFSARSMIVHFNEHRICCTTIQNGHTSQRLRPHVNYLSQPVTISYRAFWWFAIKRKRSLNSKYIGRVDPT